MERRWLERISQGAGVVFLLAYALLMTDRSARVEMAPWIVATIASFLIVLLDERKLTERALAKTFPAPSRTFYVIAAGQIAVMLHFLRTRWPDPGRPFFAPRARAYGMAALAGLAATVPQIVVELVIDPRQTDDVPWAALELLGLPLVLLLVWRFFALLDRLFDLERAAVVLGVIITFGSATAVTLAIPTPVWVTLALAMVLALALVRAFQDRRDMKSE